MKILIYSTPGYAENVFPLFKALQEKKVEVTYLLSNNNLRSTIFDVKTKVNKTGIIKADLFPELRFFSSYMNIDNVYVVNDEYRLRTPFRSFLSILRVVFFIVKRRFDIIHTDSAFQYWDVLLYIFKSKISYLQHDPFPHTGMSFSKSTIKVIKRAHKLCNRFVILNRSQFNDYCNIYNIAPDKVLVNRLGSMDCFKLVKVDAIEKKNSVLFFGSIAPYKGVEYLCQAMVKVHKIIPEATLTIAGGKSFYFDIEPYKQLSYFEIINRFIGREELVMMIKQSTICVFPYTDSTQSGCVITCYTLGKPVIASDLNTMREIIDEGKSGLLTKVKDSDSIAESIVEMLTNESRLQLMKDYIKNSYFNGERSWDSIAQKYIDYYQLIGK